MMKGAKGAALRLHSGAAQVVRSALVAQRISSGTSHVCAAGFSFVVPLCEPHSRKPAHGVPFSSTVTKPEQGSDMLSMPPYVSWIVFGPRPRSVHLTRSSLAAWCQPWSAGHPCTATGGASGRTAERDGGAGRRSRPKKSRELK